jgi:hypothetical protein
MRGLACLSLLLAGCYTDIRLDDPDGSPVPWDAGPPVVLPEGPCIEATGADILFVIDDSASMAEEQTSLAAVLPQLVRELIAPPDANADGQPDWLPTVDLHLAIVTTDMGTGGYVLPSCEKPNLGDDGLLRTIGRVDITGCSDTYPRFFVFDPSSGASPDTFSFDVGCVAQAGIGGCAWEQQLEAMLKALSPSRPTAYTGPDYVPPIFFANTAGHGDRENAGFVRDDTLLAVVIVSDEEDCSVRDPDMFNITSTIYGDTDLNLRCFTYPEALHPIERYVAGLNALRPGRPDLIALAMLIGVPADLTVDAPVWADYDRMLADPRMLPQPDPIMPYELVPSCTSSTRGNAVPPRRMVETARALSGRSTVQSICAEDYSAAIASIGRLVGQRACRRF